MFRTRFRLAAVAAMALLACAPASAGNDDDADKSDVLGAWTFQTRPYRGGTCLMVSIRSQIEEMLEAKIEGLIYMPDNFTLTIESADRMFGALVSAVTAPAEFRRANDGIS